MRAAAKSCGFVMGLAIQLALTGSAGGSVTSRVDYLALARRYAEAMIERGRDRYGEVQSPLFAVALDRRTMQLRYEVAAAPNEKAKKMASELARRGEIRLGAWPSIPGIREHDRVFNGANPQRDVDLYQLLYVLSQITGEERYARAADEAIRWFFENTRSPATNLLPWGEHLGWDFVAEAPVDRDSYRGKFVHEFIRDWLWDATYRVAPDAAVAYARGLWENQIHNPSTGNFCRHARYDRRETSAGSQFPAHGARYIGAWTEAWRRTKDPLFLRAIEVLTNHYESRRRPDGAIPARDLDWASGQRGRDTVWATQNLALAVQWWRSAEVVPEPLASKLRAAALREDEALLRGYAHELGADVATYERFRQTGHAAFRDRVLDAARTFDMRSLSVAVGYRDPNRPSAPIEGLAFPRQYAAAIFLQLRAYRLTRDRQFLARADTIAQEGVRIFLRDNLPLPAASNRHDHYEAITGGPSFMLALVHLWQHQWQMDRLIEIREPP